MSDTRSMLVRRVAQREFDKAADWYDEQRAGLGTEYIEAVNQTLARIESNPGGYAVVHEELRLALVQRFPYAIYYRVEPAQIVVVAIIHTARDPAIWQDRA